MIWNYNLFLIYIHKYIGDNKPLKISGTGKALRQFVYSRDLAKFFLWTLREYNEIDTIIFSGFYSLYI